MNRLKILAAAGLATLAFFGCGDNADDAVVVPPIADALASVPDSAQVDSAGLVAYLEVLADNTREDGSAIFGQQAHQMFPIGPRRVDTRERSPAEKLLVLGDDPVHSEIDRRDRAVGILADDDVAFLGAEHVHRLGAVRCDVVLGTRLHQRIQLLGRHLDAQCDTTQVGLRVEGGHGLSGVRQEREFHLGE